MNILRSDCLCGARLEEDTSRGTLTVVRPRWRPWRRTWLLLVPHGESGHMMATVVAHGPFLALLLGSRVLLDPAARDYLHKMEKKS